MRQHGNVFIVLADVAAACVRLRLGGIAQGLLGLLQGFLCAAGLVFRLLIQVGLVRVFHNISLFTKNKIAFRLPYPALLKQPETGLPMRGKRFHIGVFRLGRAGLIRRANHNQSDDFLLLAAFKFALQHGRVHP